MKLKEENARRIIQIARQVKTPNWSKSELLKVLKSLKSGKCRDPGGLINEIFKPDVLGSDLQEALLDLLNLCKTEMKIPDFIKLANISNIWKKKGDKMNIDSYRGIFIVNIFRSLILRLIHEDKMKIIDSHITDFQIGGRKGRNVRDHIFVVNGLIQEALSSVKSKPINIIIADFSLRFDGLNLSLACKDPYMSGCKDDKLALIYDLNRSNRVAVKTSLGMTDRFEISEKVLQGDVFGNILASNQIDRFGKHCLENQEHIYMYRDKIPIVPFTMCDDLFTVSECGYQTELMAAYINSQSRYNFLQFGLSKCFKLHVGKYKEQFKCQPVFLDSWTSEEIEDKKSGKIYFQEEYRGKVKIQEVDSEKYLGNKISTDGTNILDITGKCNRGIGIVNKNQNILETMYFGSFYFEVGKTMIESMLLGSILNNIEVAYNLTKTEIEMKNSKIAMNLVSESYYLYQVKRPRKCFTY